MTIASIAEGVCAIKNLIDNDARQRRRLAVVLKIDPASSWDQIWDSVHILADPPDLDVKPDEAAMVSGEPKLDLGRVRELVPSTLPEEWRYEGYNNSGSLFRRRGGVTVISSAHIERDQKLWLHVSASRRDRVPNYSEMCEVKRVFIGAGRMAIAIYPAEDEHFNLHPFCLHLWAPIGHAPLPDFRRESGGV